MGNGNDKANITGRATYRINPTVVCPDMEQLYFEMEAGGHVFEVGIVTILECILFAEKEKQLPKLPLTWYTEVCGRYDLPISEFKGE